MFPNNWPSFRPSQSAAGSSLMPAISNPVPVPLYPYTGIVLPHMPLIVRRSERVKICRSYTAYVPHATYIPENLEYSKEISNAPSPLNAPEQQYLDSGEEYRRYYEIEDNTTESYTNDMNTSALTESPETVSEVTDVKQDANDPLDLYLSLPKELFPSANNILIDPNPIIDEFCKLSGIENHAPWILDLEFGIRKASITRPIPMYNIKLNSVNCLSDPDVSHPDFDKCNQDFKRVFLFYYNSIVSTWYNGYIILTRDSSVDNFQSWLSLPIQILGMCWA